MIYYDVLRCIIIIIIMKLQVHWGYKKWMFHEEDESKHLPWLVRANDIQKKPGINTFFPLCDLRTNVKPEVKWLIINHPLPILDWTIIFKSTCLKIFASFLSKSIFVGLEPHDLVVKSTHCSCKNRFCFSYTCSSTPNSPLCHKWHMLLSCLIRNPHTWYVNS